MSDAISNAVKEYRTRRGLTQEDLARALGVSRQTIISIERGKYIPSLPLALKLSRYFGCSTDDMFTLDKEQGNDR
jgi:putative transcriptional regulator